MKRNGALTAIAVTVVDDVLCGGETTAINNVSKRSKLQFNLGTVVHGPKKFLFYGLQFEKDSSMKIIIDADHNLKSLEPFLTTRAKLKCVQGRPKPPEQKLFKPLNSSFVWLDISASPLNDCYSSHLQRSALSATVKDLIL